MPRVFPNNKYWLRGCRLNQKRHIDMTEKELANFIAEWEKNDI